MADTSHELPQVKERPLVTFALFAYNQEKYIREAVEAAFAQTYEPLEIILSDDCSTDGTFEIMQSLARGYRGKNKVLVNKNPSNMGLIGHVNKVFEMASGEVIVTAAGDDVSSANRTETIVELYERDTGLMAVHGQVIKIDGCGSVLGLYPPPLITQKLGLTEMATAPALAIGATGAYSRKLIEKFGPISEKDAYEDLVMFFRAALLGSIAYVEDPLVMYRYGQGISFRKKGPGFKGLIEERRCELNILAAVMRQRLRDSKTVSNDEMSVLISKGLEKVQWQELVYRKPKRLEPKVSIGNLCNATPIIMFEFILILKRGLRHAAAHFLKANKINK